MVSSSSKLKQPIMTITAHIFRREHSNLTHWLELSSVPVPVHFYCHNGALQQFRLIAIEGTKLVLNFILTASVTIKASDRLIELIAVDQSTMVIGLAVSDNADADKLMSKLHDAQKSSRMNSMAGDIVSQLTADNDGACNDGAFIDSERARLEMQLAKSDEKAKRLEHELGVMTVFSQQLLKHIHPPKPSISIPNGNDPQLMTKMRDVQQKIMVKMVDLNELVNRMNQLFASIAC